MYVGRTTRPLPARLRMPHRSARNAEWLKTCNQELAAWLEVNTPAAIVLDEVTEPGAGSGHRKSMDLPVRASRNLQQARESGLVPQTSRQC